MHEAPAIRKIVKPPHLQQGVLSVGLLHHEDCTCVIFDCGTGLTAFQTDSPKSNSCVGDWSGGKASA